MERNYEEQVRERCMTCRRIKLQPWQKRMIRILEKNNSEYSLEALTYLLESEEYADKFEYCAGMVLDRVRQFFRAQGYLAAIEAVSSSKGQGCTLEDALDVAQLSQEITEAIELIVFQRIGKIIPTASRRDVISEMDMEEFIRTCEAAKRIKLKPWQKRMIEALGISKSSKYSLEKLSYLLESEEYYNEFKNYTEMPPEQMRRFYRAQGYLEAINAILFVKKQDLIAAMPTEAEKLSQEIAEAINIESIIFKSVQSSNGLGSVKKRLEW